MIEARDLQPRQLSGDDPAVTAVLHLIQTSFAYMQGRIDPPSSMHRLTPEAVATLCQSGEVWIIGAPPVACVFLTVCPDYLYVGKLAVDASQRGLGHARRLMALAEARARARNLPALQLETRIELTENHAAFARMGFVQIADSAHPGFDRPTAITMRKTLT